ncbi:MAG: tetratricopeptide repeat protein [Polyangiaceae bacterium]|nr:tetratricopeptide repeat protein [Polyangiaceae bacterium]
MATMVRPGWARAIAAAAAIGLAAAWAAGQASPDELAQRHFESGVAYLQESDHESALRAFQKAYELSKRPEILLNLATVYERQGRLREAIAELRRYLELAPTGKHADTVKLRIQNLERRVADEPPPAASASASAEPPVAPPPSAATSAAPAAGAPARGATGAPRPPAARAAAAEPARSIVPWVFVGAGALAGIGAGVTGFLAQREYASLEDECSPSCTDAEVGAGESLALTSTALTGVAVVGIGVGVTLLLLEGPTEQRPAGWRPRVDVAVGPRASGLRLDWRFR